MTNTINIDQFYRWCSSFSSGGSVDKQEGELALTTSLLVKQGEEVKTFNKIEVDFFKNFYKNVDLYEVPNDELFRWTRFTFEELEYKCKDDFIFAKLVELNMQLGRFYVYRRSDICDLIILIYI